MGYTHYWQRKRRIAKPVFQQIRTDVQRVIDAVVARGIEIGNNIGDTGSAPTVTDSLISYNGIGDESCETFYFPRNFTPESWQRPRRRGFYGEFTKTARRNYDLAVTASLIVAKRHLGEDIAVSSDGYDSEWQDARDLCEQLFSYGARYHLVNPDGTLNAPGNNQPGSVLKFQVE